IAALAVTVPAACDLAADLSGRELRRVHVRVGDARPDRFLTGREVAHVVSLSGRPDHVGGGDRPANGAGRCGRTRRLAASATEEHGDAAVDVELADMDGRRCGWPRQPGVREYEGDLRVGHRELDPRVPGRVDRGNLVEADQVGPEVLAPLPVPLVPA